MLVGIWLGLHRVLFYFFDHYIQSSGRVIGAGPPLAALGSVESSGGVPTFILNCIWPSPPPGMLRH